MVSRLYFLFLISIFLHNGNCWWYNRRQNSSTRRITPTAKPVVSSNNGCYGNVRNCDTTGASQKTSRQDGLSYYGVSASYRMAETDSTRMKKYKSLILTAGSELCVDPAVIAGIISRESRAGAALDRNGYGDHGNGYGLMQVDKRYHTLKGGPYSLTHIKQGTEILISMINGVSRNHASWSKDMKLKGGISAYNAGVKNVRSYQNMDIGTTGNDYANDVVARAKWYKNHGY